VIGLVLALGIGWGASVVLAQGPTPQWPTQAQMEAMHDAMHGEGSWDAMVLRMQQYFGQDWFNQMHGPNGMMNGTNWQNHMGGYGGMTGTVPPGMGRPPVQK
jgi:hypothetical protein